MNVRPTIPVLYYNTIFNVGDQLNPFLLPRLFDVDVTLATLPTAPHLAAIGSILQATNERSQVWGTGVMHDTYRVPNLSAGNVHAVRGKLSYQWLRSGGINLRDIPLGEPGFLANDALRDTNQPKRFEIGIVPHYQDRRLVCSSSLVAEDSVADLSVHSEPGAFLADMASCRVVVSSSLHGLVLAESLGIPNVWVKFSDRTGGGKFKFLDWFSLAARPQLQPYVPAGVSSKEILRELSAGATLHEFPNTKNDLISAFPRAWCSLHLADRPN
jgi:pyruvyltransferase